MGQLSRAIALLTLLSCCAPFARAKETLLPAPPPGFRIGMEMEMLPKEFSTIAGYFDFDQLQKDHGEMLQNFLPEDFYDDYLRDSPQALSELPEELRKKLTQGLKLDETVLGRGQHLVDSSGKKLDAVAKQQIVLPHSGASALSHPQIILPGNPPSSASANARPSIILPGASEPRQALASRVTQTQGELIVPKNTAWQTLYERWKALDLDTKRSVVRWENLNSLKKAEIVFGKYVGGPGSGMAALTIQPKAVLPPEEKQLFERLQYSKDGPNALEFRHRQDVIVSDPNEFYHDVALLAKRAGIDNKILNPQNSKLTTAGLHFHISVQGSNLEELGRAYNRLAFIRRIHGGDLGDLTHADRYGFDPTAHTKGHVRIVGKDRLEFRNHSIRLHDELDLILKSLAAERTQGLKMVDDVTRSLMSDYVVDRIAELRPDLLEHFMPYLNQEQTRKVQSALELAKRMKPLLSPYGPEKIYELAPEALQSRNWMYHRKAVEGLSRISRWPDSFWKTYVNLVDQAPAAQRAIILEPLVYRNHWPLEVWKRMPSWLSSITGSATLEPLILNLAPGKWPAEFWNELPRLIKDGDSSLVRSLAPALAVQDHWPVPIWSAVLDRLRSANADAKVPLALAVTQQMRKGAQSQSHEAIEVLRTLAESSDPTLRRIASEALTLPQCETAFSKVK